MAALSQVSSAAPFGAATLERHLLANDLLR